MRASELNLLIYFKTAVLITQGIAVFFFLAPSHESIGTVFLVASLFVSAIIRCNETTKVRFLYTISAIFLTFIWLPLLGYEGWKIYFFIYAGAFLAGFATFKNMRDRQLAFILVFFLPWVAHLLIGAQQIGRHLLTFNATDFQHLLVTSKSSLSVGVKYYSSILSFVIVSSWVLFGMIKNAIWKYCFVLALFLLSLIDNRVALFSVTLSMIIYYLTFRKSIEAVHAANHTFRLMIGVGVILMFIVYYPRLVLGYESVIAALNFQEYHSWEDNDLFLKEFCKGVGSQCTVDQSVFYRLSWFFWGLSVVYDNPMGVGLGAGPLDRALALYDMHTGEYLARDFHSELMNIAVVFGVPGALFVFALFGLIFLAFKKKMIVANNEICFRLAYVFLSLLFLRFVIESVGGVGMYLFLSLLFAAITTEATRVSKSV